MTEITKHTRLANISEQPDGSLIVQFALTVEEGGAVLGSRTHTMRIEPGQGVEDKIAEVTDHLSGGIHLMSPSMLGSVTMAGKISETAVKYPAPSPDVIAIVRRKADEAWTPEIAGAWQQRRAKEAEDAAMEEAYSQAVEENQIRDEAAAESRRIADEDRRIAAAVAAQLAKLGVRVP